MKGTVSMFVEKQKKDNSGSYLTVSVLVDGENKSFICTDQTTQALVRANQGKEIEFETFGSKDGSATFMSLPKPKSSGTGGTGWKGAAKQPGKDTSFAASYAKDITVAAMNNSQVAGSVQIEASLRHFFKVFMDLLEEK